MTDRQTDAMTDRQTGINTQEPPRSVGPRIKQEWAPDATNSKSFQTKGSPGKL